MTTKPGEEPIGRRDYEREQFAPMIRPDKTRLHSFVPFTIYGVWGTWIQTFLIQPFYGYE